MALPPLITIHTGLPAVLIQNVLSTFCAELRRIRLRLKPNVYFSLKGKKNLMVCYFFSFHSSVYNFIRIKKKGSLKQSSKCDEKISEKKKTLKLINKLSDTRRCYCILTRLRILKNKWQKCINKRSTLESYCPLASSLRTRQRFPSRYPISRHMTAFLKLGTLWCCQILHDLTMDPKNTLRTVTYLIKASENNRREI